MAGKSSAARSSPPSSPILTMLNESEGEERSFGDLRGRRCWKGTVFTLTGRGATRTMLLDITFCTGMRQDCIKKSTEYDNPASPAGQMASVTALPPSLSRICADRLIPYTGKSGFSRSRDLQSPYKSPWKNSLSIYKISRNFPIRK